MRRIGDRKRRREGRLRWSKVQLEEGEKEGRGEEGGGRDRREKRKGRGERGEGRS